MQYVSFYTQLPHVSLIPLRESRTCMVCLTFKKKFAWARLGQYKS